MTTPDFEAAALETWYKFQEMKTTHHPEHVAFLGAVSAAFYQVAERHLRDQLDAKAIRRVGAAERELDKHN